MTTIITRMYETVAKANAAAAELAEAGFRSAHYQVVSVTTAKKKSERAGNQAALAALKEAGVIPRAAAVYAEHIASGNALVVVKAHPEALAVGLSSSFEEDPEILVIKGETLHSTIGRQASALRFDVRLPVVAPQSQGR